MARAGGRDPRSRRTESASITIGVRIHHDILLFLRSSVHIALRSIAHMYRPSLLSKTLLD